MTDTGIGIAPENVERILEEFSQIDSPTQRRVKGTGLGLPLCGRLAELLGGHVAVTSQLSTGFTFTVRYGCARRRIVSPSGGKGCVLSC